MLTDTRPLSSCWDGTSLPLANCKAFQTNDIDEVREHMSHAHSPHSVNADGRALNLAFRHNQAKLRAMTFNAVDYGLFHGRVTVQVLPPEKSYFVQFSLAGTSYITCQNKTIELAPGHLCVLNTDKPVREVFDGDYKHFTVKIPQACLEAVIVREFGFRPDNLEFATDSVPLRGAAGAFAQFVGMICGDINAGGETYSHPRISGSAEDTLTRLLLAAVPHNYSDFFNVLPAAAAPYYIRRVEEYIREHAGDPVSLADMVRVAGVSSRSLHTGFRRFRNTTPMGYLKSYRLELAHSHLKTGIDHGLTVTDVALVSGFTHLSKFARDYYERYNERPSDTLRRVGGG